MTPHISRSLTTKFESCIHLLWIDIPYWFFLLSLHKISCGKVFSGVHVVTIRWLPPIFQILGRKCLLICIWHPIRLCLQYPIQNIFPLQHIWISSLQIFMCAPSTYIWTSQWFDCMLLVHDEFNITVLDHQQCISAIHTRQVRQGRSSSCPVEKCRLSSHTSTVQEFPIPSPSPSGACTHFCCDAIILMLEL